MIDYENWDCRSQGVVLRLGNNVQATKGLFYEHLSDTAAYTLKNEDVIRDGKHYVSAYQVYMHSIDESDAALKLVGSYRHWRKLLDLDWFVKGDPQLGHEGLEQWRIDMDQRDRTLAKKQLLESAANGNVQAQKLMYGADAPKKAGRKAKPKPEQSKPRLDLVSELSRIEEG